MSSLLEESVRMKRMVRLGQGCRSVLDIGWAQSPNPFFANDNGVGVDLNRRALPHNYHESGAGDAREMVQGFSGRRFDAIVAGEILEHVEQPHAFLRDCRLLLNA